MEDAADESSHAGPIASPDSASLLNASVELARLADRAQDARAFGEALARLAARLTRADQASVGVVGEGEVVTLAALPAPQAPVGSRFPIGFGVAGWVAATGRAAAIPDVRSDARYVALSYPEVRSFVALPLATDAEIVGVLGLAAWQPNAFPVDLDRALAPVAEQAAIALRRKLADDRARTRAEPRGESPRPSGRELTGPLRADLEAVAGLIEAATSERAGRLGHEQRELLETALLASRRALGEMQATVDRPTDRAGGPVDPRAVARQAVDEIRVEAARRDVGIQIETDESAAAVDVDAASLRQVLTTLLRQAHRRSSPATVVTLAVTGLDGWTCFMVADRADGIPSDEIQRLFGPSDGGMQPAVDDGQDPLALELWLARQIVERQGGRMWAEPREDEGTRVCFAFEQARRSGPESGMDVPRS